jgi:hypothetical protein
MCGLPITFKDDVELMEFAEKFVINDRIASLENDVERCIPDDKKEAAANAPFPALMYCFSIIDLLGSLYAGNARSGNTTDNSARYMEDYLNYPRDKLRLLQKIYRHKIIHSSQPKFAMLYNKQIIAIAVSILGSFGKIHCYAQYIVSIKALKDDIKSSVTRYLRDLKNNADLQSKFVTAINQIYDPVVTD